MNVPIAAEIWSIATPIAFAFSRSIVTATCGSFAVYGE